MGLLKQQDPRGRCSNVLKMSIRPQEEPTAFLSFLQVCVLGLSKDIALFDPIIPSLSSGNHQ